MTFESLASKTAGWLDGSGQRADLVISSRIRLARNLDAFPFVNRLRAEEKQKVVELVAPRASHWTPIPKSVSWPLVNCLPRSSASL
jgi:protein-arginine kinase